MSTASTPLSGVNQPLKGIGFILLATFLFASHDTLSKYLSGFYPIILVVWARYLVHTLLMACIFMPSAGLRVLRTKRPGLQALRALALLGTSLLFTSSLMFIPQAEATAVNFLAPLLVTALSVPLLHERVTRGQWIAVVVGFVGVMIIIHPGGELFTPAILLPLSFGLVLCAVSTADPTGEPVRQPDHQQLLCRSVQHAVDERAGAVFLGSARALALGACGMSAHLLLTQAFRFAAPAMLAPFSYCQIVFAGLLGFLVFDHMPSPTAQAGIAIICLSGLAAAWQQRRKGG